jgi:hypothetical protein
MRVAAAAPATRPVAAKPAAPIRFQPAARLPAAQRNAEARPAPGSGEWTTF